MSILPLAAPPPTIAPTGAPRDTRVSAQRVMIVDDNEDAAEMLGMLLETTGHETCVITESPAAIAAARAFRPEVVVLDLGMPVLDGFEIARALRADDELRDVVLVALTGWGADEDRERCRDAGFDHHLTKPVTASTVHKLLATLG